ncbi:hypothetical protein KOW79_001357 [Hemibagrus wyckioides]|uniref:C-type lectin domain-containing protein n=1 Tax=Hemibagrus wyckioides TaxID=337641 RepID=A0A9D3SRL3_9TELE|nr:hypothetical protein KOW79_001357 [Hemibagrus wyckioides]
MKQNKHIYSNVTSISERDLKLKCPLDAHTLPEQDRNHSAGDCKLKNVTVTSHKQIRRCSAGERQIQYKDRLYIFPADEMSWISSREKCQELGGDLVIINSKQEHKFLVGAMNTFINSLHWIGLRNAEKEGRWLWVDETPLMQNLSWWKDTEVDTVSAREDCVGYYDGQWVDLPCSTSERRIYYVECPPGLNFEHLKIPDFNSHWRKL